MAANVTYRRRWKAKVCLYCESPKLVTRAFCEKHRVYSNAVALPGRRRRTERIRKERHAEHLCVVCGDAAVTRRHCQYHRELHNAAVRRSIAKRKLEAKQRGRR